MNKQWLLIKAAIGYYTRIPVGKLELKEEDFAKSSRYFTLIGYIQGLLVYLVWLIINPYFNPLIQAMLLVTVGILLTGALHEDGFADACDGFGGGYESSQILTIMKDSRLGTFGTIGLILILLAKILLLAALIPNHGLATLLISIYVLSRLFALPLTWWLPYARPGKSPTHNMVSQMQSLPHIIMPWIIVLPLFIINHWWFMLVALLTLSAMSLTAIAYLQKKIKGYTGDCIGALQQINEVILLLIYSLIDQKSGGI